MRPLHAVVMGATATALLAACCRPLKPEWGSRSNSNPGSSREGGRY